MISRFQPFRLLPPIVLIAVVSGLSYWLNPEPWHHLTLTEKSLFGGAFLVMLGLMAGMRGRSWLRIDERGVEIQYGFGAPRFFAWEDVVSARVARKRLFLVPVMSTVQLHLRNHSTGALLRAARAINRYEASLPAFFDLSAEEIVERIDFHLKQRSPSVEQ